MRAGRVIAALLAIGGWVVPTVTLAQARWPVPRAAEMAADAGDFEQAVRILQKELDRCLAEQAEADCAPLFERLSILMWMSGDRALFYRVYAWQTGAGKSSAAWRAERERILRNRTATAQARSTAAALLERWDEAEAILQIDLAAHVASANGLLAADASGRLGMFRIQYGRNVQRGESDLRRAIDLAERFEGNDTARVAPWVARLASELLRQGRYGEAAERYNQMLRISLRDQVVFGVHGTTNGLYGLARSLTGLGRHMDAYRLYQARCRLLGTTVQAVSRPAMGCESDMAKAAVRRRDWSRAHSHYQRLMALVVASSREHRDDAALRDLAVNRRYLLEVIQLNWALQQVSRPAGR